MKVLLFLVLVFLASAGAAAAQSCSYNVSNVNFGDVNLLSGGAIDGSATLDITCTNVLNVSLAGRICFNLDAGSGGASGGIRTMANGSSLLQYQLYRDSARTIPWGTVDTVSLGSPNIMDFLLLPLTTVTTSRTIYARIIANQQTALGGTYVSSFSGAQVRFNMVQYSITPPACASVTQNANHPTFTVQANVQRTCNVTAQDLNFGSRGAITTRVDSASQLQVNCTSGLPYTIGLNGGNSSAAPTARKMTRGGQSIIYGLYRDAARSLAWGNSSGLLAAGTGTGLSQAITIYGRVPVQSTPLAGTYSDTVVVTLTY